MNANEHELIYKDEVYKIGGAAMEVSNELGCGFLEAVYEEALMFEFNKMKIPHTARKEIEITYKGQILKKRYYADFLCFGSVIVEIKAIKKLTEIEDAQILNYLKASGMPIGILINFENPKLEWKRYANTKD